MTAVTRKVTNKFDCFGNHVGIVDEGSDGSVVEERYDFDKCVWIVVKCTTKA